MNALGTLFGDIASAIREKTGDTATMKPAEFPEKIAAIEASGGGSLPAGAYLSASSVRPHITYPYKRFVLNGVLYATASNNGADWAISNIYKWNGSTWSTVLTSNSTTGINGTTISNRSYNIAEFNGKIHFVDKYKHATFNGSSLVLLNDLPYSTYGTCLCVYQNKLVCYMYGSGKLYEWVESGDTWKEIATIGSQNQYLYIAAINDVMYVFDSSKAYRFENGVLVQCGTTKQGYATMVARNNKVYSLNMQTYYCRLFEYDPVTNTEKFWELPPIAASAFTYGGDEFSFMGAGTLPNSNVTQRFPCYVVNIVEDTV